MSIKTHKGLLWRTAMLIGLMITAVNASAQTLVITPDVRADKATPITAGVLNAYEGSGHVLFALDLSDKEIASVVSYTATDGATVDYVLNSTTHELSAVGEISFDTARDILAPTFTIVYTTVGSSTQKTVSATAPYGVKVWPKGAVSYNTPEKSYILSGRGVELSAEGTGGYDQGWRYSWSTGATTSSINYVNTVDINYSPSRTTPSVRVYNYAPDGTSIWEEYSHEYEIMVYAMPSVQNVSWEPSNVIFAGDEVSIIIDNGGGNPDGWSFEWTGVSSSDGARATLKTQEGTLDYNIKVTSKNVSPDGDVWLEMPAEFSPTVYPTPSVAWTEPERKTWIDGETISFLAMPSGGETGEWTYEWRVDGQVVNMLQWTNRFEYTAINKTSEPVKRTITATLTNTPYGIATPYSETFTYECTVYPTPTLSDITTETPVVFDETSVTLSATTAGGNPEGWTYSWTRNGSVVEGVDGPSVTEVAYIGDAPVTWRYELTATNDYGFTPYVLRKEFTVLIYPKPAGKIVAPERTEWFNGQNVALSTTVSGGDASAWTYVWKVDDQEVAATGPEYTYLAINTGDAQVERKVTVTVTNSPEGIDKPFSETYEYSCIVYPSIEVTVNDYKNVVFNGTEVAMTVDYTGGKPDSWKWNWTLDGNTMGAESDLTITAANTGNSPITQKYILTATNIIEYTLGRTEQKLTREFEVTIWPSPSATLTPPDRDKWLSEEMFTLNVNPNGGDPTAWTYEWKIDDTVLSERLSPSYTYTVRNPGKRKFTVTATNEPEGIDVPFSETFTYDFTVYPTPSITQNQYKKVVFNETQVEMSITTSGGYPEGWTYSWTKDGAKIDSETTSLTDVPVNNGTTAITYNYKVTAVNTAGGENVEMTEEFAVTVWPTASATLTTPERYRWLNGETFPLNVNPNGGDPTAWTYEWKDGNQVIGDNAAVLEYLTGNTGKEGVNHTITVTATNKPEDIDAPAVYTFDYEFTVYPTPSITQNQYKEVVFSGTPVEMTITPFGGYPEGWTYSWTKEGAKIDGETASLTDAPVNNGTGSIAYTYVVTAVNTLDDQVNTFTETFTVTVWPTPETAFPTNLPENIVSGDMIRIPLSYKDGDSDAWNFVWKVDGKEMQNSAAATYDFTGINGNQNGSVSQVVTVEATNSPEGIDKAYTATYDYTFIVWPGPTTEMLLGEKQVTCDGRTLTLGVSHTGGQEGNWLFDWTLNGTALTSHEAALPVTFVNTNPEMRTDVYTVTSTNVVEGEVRYERTDTYTVDIYHRPETEQGRSDWDAYYYSNIVLGIVPTYGYPYGWKYEWTDGLPDAEKVEYTVPSSATEDSFDHTVTLTVTNGYGEGDQYVEWYRQTYTFDITCWSRGEIQSTTTLDEDYNGTISELLATSQKGGYDKGWTYQWSLNGKALTSGQPSLEISETNYGEKSEYYDFSLVAVNTLEGVEGCRRTMHYMFTLWPVIDAPEEFEVSQMNVRNGTYIVLNVAPKAATGGYEYYWVYDWTANDRPLNNNNPVISTQASITNGAMMAYADIVYGLTLTNPGPKETTWYQNTFATKTVRVYNRPLTPYRLERKGNGTTCTMIVLMRTEKGDVITDTELAEYNYKYVFGYTDASGAEHAMPAVGERYYRFDSSVYNNSSNRFWVYALWSYDNGVSVTSTRRYLDGSTDDFDGSSFETGRGDSAGLDEIAVDDDEIYVSAHGFKVNLSTPAEATVNIINTAGAGVFHKEYPTSESISESFSSTKLAPGVYILSVKAGATVKFKKIVIK